VVDCSLLRAFMVLMIPVERLTLHLDSQSSGLDIERESQGVGLGSRTVLSIRCNPRIHLNGFQASMQPATVYLFILLAEHE
jgi:hypothetical protein